MKKTLHFLLVFLCAVSFAQKKEAWTEVDKLTVNPSDKIRKSVLPADYKLYQFDYHTFAGKLVDVPNRDYITGQSNVIVTLPMPNGKMEDFRIVEASVFDEELQSQFPEIRSFAGQGVQDPSKNLRFSISPYNGLSAMIRVGSEKTTYIIDPFSIDYKTVIVYDRSKTTKSVGEFICTTEDAVREFGIQTHRGGNVVYNNADDANLRRFRMAQSCTAEYANYFGATSAAQVNLVLAAFNATYTRVNGVFEMDFNATFVIIAQSTNVIYYNPATDPYSAAANMANWNLELQNNLSANLTGPATSLAANNAAYDIGHLFGATGGGGNAGCIGCVCDNDTASTTDEMKGAGITSPADGIPMGDSFDIDYVAHEIGHQMGGNHTWTFGGNEGTIAQVEPGSGSTIMGYAGITGATDLQAHSDALFHAVSIQQITNNIKAKSCPVIVPISNAVPTANAGADLTLPIGTPFRLDGIGTDANTGDALTYIWEQMDDNNAATTYPSPTATSGVAFRSWEATTSPTRIFPRIEDLLSSGVNGTMWEKIPTVNRTMNFRFTVRDNKPGGGANESDNMVVTFTNTRGPLAVTSQNTTGINYQQGSTQTVTWTVNNTNLMTGAANVNIKLSTDGGYTYPITLLANTPNDGSQAVTIPNVFAPYCRIMVEAAANNFFAINTQTFSIGYSVTEVCNNYTANPAGAIPQGSYAGWAINVPDNVTVTDVNVTTGITHARRNQIYAFVRKAGTPNIDVNLFQTGGCANPIANLNGTFDDESANANGCGTTNNFGNMQPLQSLTAFDGTTASGNWILAVADATNDTRTGTVDSFTFNICYKQVIETPIPCGQISTTWNGSTWSNGAPLRNVAVTFAGNYTSTGDLEACSITVNSGVNVTIGSGHTFVVGGSVTVNGTGTLTVNNNGALRQLDGAAVNTGNIIVKRDSAPMVRLDYTAWSSPVSGQQLQAFSPNTLPTRFYQYLYTGTTTPTAYQSVSPTTNFVVGKGYMIRAADNWPTTLTTFNGQFTGVPNNGNVSQPVGVGYNLLGNPYASPIDARAFLSANPSVGTLYFWTHTVAASGGVYPVNNYASYTTLGGTASAAGGAVPNGFIQTGQGFFVNATAAGNLNFTNTQRVNASSSTQFFRTSNAAVTQEVNNEVHRIWLNLNDASNNYNQILVGYTNGATNGYDHSIDGEVLDKSTTMLYNVINDTEYVIQGKGLPFADTDEVALGLKATAAGTYTISLGNVDGLFASQDVFVKDNVTNIIHDIKQAPYVFTTEAGTFNTRFKLVYKNTVMSNEDFVPADHIVVFVQNDVVKVDSTQEIASVQVFDVLGRNIYTNDKVNEKTLSIASIANRNQALIVKVALTNGQTIARKVIK